MTTVLPDVRKTFSRAPIGAGHAREKVFAGMARSYNPSRLHSTVFYQFIFSEK
jgi:hypothetical protein